MCLQWCHVQSWLIDNDLVCIGCDRHDPATLPSWVRCATCSHQLTPDGQSPQCGLTREALPILGGCCHWNATLIVPSHLSLSSGDLAPWLGNDVLAVFAASPSAPLTLSAEDGCMSIVLSDLAVPLVYGVPAEEWGDALGWSADAVPLDFDDVSQHATVAALEALETDNATFAIALDTLRDALNTTVLPTEWHEVIVALLLLGRERYASDMLVCVRLDNLEEQLCISL